MKLSMKIFFKNNDKIPEERRHGIYEVENWGTYYYVNGKLHRKDGPAYERYDGYKAWHINDKLHRLDGPAVDCGGYKQYWIKGLLYLTKEEIEKAAYMYKNGLQDYL